MAGRGVQASTSLRTSRNSRSKAVVCLKDGSSPAGSATVITTTRGLWARASASLPDLW